MKHSTWIVMALLVSAVAYYAATFGFGHTLGSTMRFRIILGMLFAQSVGLVIAASSVMTLLNELRPYQRAASQLAVMKGMQRTLEIVSTQGGVSAEGRDAVYKEFDEVFGVYASLMRNGDFGA